MPKFPEGYVPFPDPITLDTLDELLAAKRATFEGWTMKADDDGDDVDIDGDDVDTDDDDDETDDDETGDDETGDDDDEKLGDGGKKALVAERKKVRDLQRQLREATKQKKKGDDDGDDDAEAKVVAKWKPRVVKASAKTALLAAGGEKPERLLRLVDLDALDVDDDGEVSGLDDEVDRLKEEYPELFKRRRAGKVETGDRSKGGAKKPLSATERQAAQLRGGK